jgi:hypothetical protein
MLLCGGAYIPCFSVYIYTPYPYICAHTAGREGWREGEGRGGRGKRLTRAPFYETRENIEERMNVIKTQKEHERV